MKKFELIPNVEGLENSRIKELQKKLQNQGSLYSRNEECFIGVRKEEIYRAELDESMVNESRRISEESTNNFKPFESLFKPSEMRCLALVAQNHMKPAMEDFVEQRQELLKKFRLTGTNTTMTMVKSIFGDDKDVIYGPSFKSGPLGGDTEVGALMWNWEDLGGVLFFMDPLNLHPHQSDIDSGIRLAKA